MGEGMPVKRTPVRHTASEKQKRQAWRDKVMDSTNGRCIISGAWAQDAHHIIPKQSLKRRNLDAHLWDERNGMPLSRRVHERHTTAVERVPRTSLPQPAEEFAAELGLSHLLDRYYGERD